MIVALVLHGLLFQLLMDNSFDSLRMLLFDLGLSVDIILVLLYLLLLVNGALHLLHNVLVLFSRRFLSLFLFLQLDLGDTFTFLTIFFSWRLIIAVLVNLYSHLILWLVRLSLALRASFFLLKRRTVPVFILSHLVLRFLTQNRERRRLLLLGEL